jgi:hypothetical protein
MDARRHPPDPPLIAYVFDRNRGKLKAAAVREFLKGVTVEQIERDARAFAQAHAPSLLRPDALAVWRSLAGQGRQAGDRHRLARRSPSRPSPGAWAPTC